MEQLKSYQQKLFREFEKNKNVQQLPEIYRASIMAPMYQLIEKAYKKGMKRGKNEIIEVINNLKI